MRRSDLLTEIIAWAIAVILVAVVLFAIGSTVYSGFLHPDHGTGTETDQPIDGCWQGGAC